MFSVFSSAASSSDGEASSLEDSVSSPSADWAASSSAWSSWASWSGADSAAGASLAGGQQALLHDLLQLDRHPGEQRVQRAHQAGDGRGDHAHQLAVQHVEGGQPAEGRELLDA